MELTIGSKINFLYTYAHVEGTPFDALLDDLCSALTRRERNTPIQNPDVVFSLERLTKNVFKDFKPETLYRAALRLECWSELCSLASIILKSGDEFQEIGKAVYRLAGLCLYIHKTGSYPPPTNIKGVRIRSGALIKSARETPSVVDRDATAFVKAWQRNFGRL